MSRSIWTALIVAMVACATEARAEIGWSPPIEIAVGGGQKGPWQQNNSKFDYVDDPSVALDPSSAAAVVFVDQGHKDVFFQVYEPSGAARFPRPVNVSRSAQVFSWLPRLVISPLAPSDIFVVWQEIIFSGGSHGGDILFARSIDGGASFERPKNLSHSIGGDGKARITKELWHNGSLDLAIGPNGSLDVAWTDYEGRLWFTASPDRGASFTNPRVIVDGGEATPARAPALAVGADNTIYLAWTIGERIDADVRVARSIDGGRKFSEPVIVARTSGYSDAPKLAVDHANTLHIVYSDSAGGPFEQSHVRYTRSRDGGRTFETGRMISLPIVQPLESAGFPAFGLDGRDAVYVLWEVSATAGEQPRALALTYSTDAGDTFTTPAIVPGSSDPKGGWNGSQQGHLMRKLAVAGSGTIAVVNSSLKPDDQSRVWLIRGQTKPEPAAEPPATSL